ncbi:MAG TPA: ClpX C4-type zinc finger protein [Pyrinomonadaceae bacterium]
MAVDDSLNPPPTSEYIQRWMEAIEKAQYDSALSILDEGLQAATRENNAEEIDHYTNLKKYTHNMVEILTTHKERNIETRYCSMCGKGEADGCILIAGAECVICDGCIKICLGVIDTLRREHGKEFECSFCGKKESEVSRIIAGPGVSICDNCVNICSDILAKDIARLETETD